MTERLKIGISACFLYPDPARTAFAKKTLQYVEQSVPQWVMSGGALPVMIPSPVGVGTGAKHFTNEGDGVSLGDYAQWLDGLVLHGGTPVGKRRELVKRFQEDEQCPFFVLSLKAGGTGLNLTAASHVIHFDRWWNPAVENQATDRAWRIGQHRNVLAHKFVCRGTIEERIDEMIRSKQQLAQNLLEGGAEINLTTMSDAELLDLIRLDIHSIGE